MPQLALIRHGQSEWNLQNRFTGWVDVDLTEEGVAQAKRSGELLAEAGFKPSRAFVSVLKRAIKTLHFTLEGLDRLWIPETKSWRLNERHYGGLAGLNKDEMRAQHGEEQVKIWRRSFDTPPPPLSEDHEFHPRGVFFWGSGGGACGGAVGSASRGSRRKSCLPRVQQRSRRVCGAL